MEIGGVASAGITNNSHPDSSVKLAQDALSTLKSASEVAGEGAVKLVESLPIPEKPAPSTGSVGSNINTYA